MESPAIDEVDGPPSKLPKGDVDKPRLEMTEIEHALKGLDHLSGLRTLSAVPPSTPQQSQDRVYSVWFATNRKPKLAGNGFGNERHDQLTRGRVDVFIPKSHRKGEIGNGLFKNLVRLNLTSDRLRVQQITRQDFDSFHQELRQASDQARADGLPAHGLLFLHGYNVSFEEAAIRAAQIGFDLDVPGPTAFFSWPSRSELVAYPVDEATIEASEEAITQFLVEFAQTCGADKVHVIAHSMGNRGLLRALQRIAGNAETASQLRLGQVFLAAPDVDRDLFRDLAKLYPAFAENTTLYTSCGDLPVHASAKLHAAPRAGYFAPYTVVPGIDTVAIPDFDLDLLGHTYFAQAKSLLDDLHLLMFPERSAELQRQIVKTHEDGMDFWLLPSPS
jgi:esterase/lipase superfamily enzyme